MALRATSAPVTLALDVMVPSARGEFLLVTGVVFEDAVTGGENAGGSAAGDDP